MSDAQNLPVERRQRSPSNRRKGLAGEPLQVLLGRRLRRLRMERGFDRADIAARLGVPVDQVAAHERGTRRFEAQELLDYVRLLEVRVSSFFVRR